MLAAAFGPVVRGQGWPAWWDGRWPYRMLVRFGRQQDWPDSPGAQLWVHLRKDADNGGKDIRVVGPDGNPVGFAVIHAAPEGRYLIAFRTQAAPGTYAVYYGNPRASPVNPDLPQLGLIYETRPMPDNADANSWTAAQATLQRAGPAYGADYWRQVFDASNPFGPQSDYIAVYRGYLRTPKAGRYRFATVSDCSSFLLIDDQLVTQWIGRHNVNEGRRGEHGGEIYLDQRIHKFLYVHFVSGGNARSEAAWMPPDQQDWQVIPPQAFAGLRTAEVYECEWYGQPICADFTVEPRSYCEAGDARMLAIQFASRCTTARNTLIDSYRWDFGDGQTSDEPRPGHVFLDTADYAVTLAITNTAGDRTSCTKTVRASPIWNDLDFRRSKLEAFWRDVKGYDLGALPTPCLLAAWQFARYMEADAEAFAAALALDQRRTSLKREQVYEVAMDIARCYDELKPDPDRAEQYFALALQSVPESDRGRQFDVRFALSEHYLLRRGDPQRARAELEKLRADFPQADREKLRRALIRVGDTYRKEGKAEEALERYRQAEADPAFVPDKPKALTVGSSLQQVESYLRDGEPEQALERLDELLWLYPTMRMEGQPSRLRVQAYLVKGEFAKARDEAEVFIATSKDANHLPALRLLAAEACSELGLMQEAAAHYRAILHDFPEAPEVREAEDGLRRLGL